MEPEGSLPYSQQPVTGPYLSQMNPVHNPEPYLIKINFNTGWAQKNFTISKWQRKQMQRT
jgi:hypothetical protein